MEVTYRRATQEDLKDIAPILRQADKNEIAASTGMEPLAALRFCESESDECWFAYDAEGPLAIFGIKESVGLGVIWMLGTDRTFKELRKTFMRESKRWLKDLCKPGRTYWNNVDSRNTKHLAWLKRVGAEINMDKPYRLSDPSVPFYMFTYKR